MTVEYGRSKIARLKAPTGIRGLDSLTYGGLPRGRVTLLEGPPGAGKTMLALQSLVHAARHLSEPGIFVAFEQHPAHVAADAAAFGWDLPALQRRLFFLDAQPNVDLVQAGEFDLGGLLAALKAKIDQIRARRIVLDGIDHLLSSLGDIQAERRELNRLREWLLAQGLTTIITSKTSVGGHAQQRAELLQFMVDCAVSLEHCAVEGVSQRSLRILKYRGSGFHENSAPYLIGPSGADVAGVEESSGLGHAASVERVSTGVARLDAMLGGGFFRGAAILASGAPGTAKTTLGGAFAEAACRRGEPTLFISFDSQTSEVVRNLRSVGIRLGRYLGHGKSAGLLRMSYQRALFGSAETHLLQIQSLAREQRTRCMVIDPLSALANVNDQGRVNSVAKRLLHWAKTEDITIFCTSLLDDQGVESEGTPLHISTIADTWMHLSYVARNGERNRCLSIVKSRGTAHSNQVRELLLSEAGITLADAYSASGEVLLGTMRYQRERSEEAARQEAERADRLNRRKLVIAEVELGAQVTALQQQLEAKRAELEELEQSTIARRETVAVSRKEALIRRGADTPLKRRRVV
jgi:circadian clock protein KaiC